MSHGGMHSREISKKVGLTEFEVLEILTTTFSKLSEESEVDREIRELIEPALVSPRDLKIIELRKSGKTLDEIGKEVALTRERVRQILKKIVPDLNFEEIRIETQLREKDEINQQFHEVHQLICDKWYDFQYMKFAEIAQILDVPEWKVRKSLSRIQYVYLQANEERKVAQSWTDEQCLESLRIASTYSFPLTVLKYRKLLEVGEISGPTPALMWQRFGSWVTACELAGVEYGEAMREYNRTWNDVELVKFVRRFMHSREDGKWAIEKYEDWRRLPEVEGPSAALLRLRLGTWSEIRVLALELKVEGFDMQSFAELRQGE
jgi:predicted transcriptional regulator